MADERAQVLVVDDERFFREAIRDALVARDFLCATCEDGESALKLVAAQTFSVAVVDTRLPGIDGIELLQQLRLSQPDMQVIVISSSIDQELVLDALRFGAGEYLGKPLHDEELGLAVERSARVYGLARDQRRLRARLDDLVNRLEAFTREVAEAETGTRNSVVHEAAARIAAHALGAEKTSLLLADMDGSTLQIAATYGRELTPSQMDRVEVGAGIAGRAFEDSTPLVVADVRAESHFAADLAPARYSTNSFVMTPVALPGQQLGLLCATDRSDGLEFNNEDLSVLRAIAVHVAILLDAEPSAELTEAEPSLDLAVDVSNELLVEPDPSERDAELARTICDVMSNEPDPDLLLGHVLHEIEASLEADPVSLYLIEPETGDLVLEATGTRSLRIDRDRLPVGRGLMEGVLVRGQLIASSDPVADPRFDASVDAPMDEKPGALLAVPLKLRGKTVGLCRIHRPLGDMVPVRTGEMLVALLSAAVRNMLLYRSLLESIEEVAQARRDARN